MTHLSGRRPEGLRRVATGGCAEEDLSRPSSGATDLNLARSIIRFLLHRIARMDHMRNRVTGSSGLELTRARDSRRRKVVLRFGGGRSACFATRNSA